MLARFAVARPRLVLAVWLVAIGMLGFVGLGLEDHLHRKSDLAIPGTSADRAAELARERFGESVMIPVLLEGPPRAVDQQGRRLAAALEREPGVSLLSPWMLRDESALRPRRDAAMLIVSSKRPFEEVSKEVVPEVRADVDRIARRPVEAHVTGTPDVAAGVHTATVKAVERAELLAAPLLMIVLLLVFRSPVAAALPLLVGMTTIGASRGVLEIVNGSRELDALALNMNAMMGLALGVDYALLLVSRFREELAVRAAARHPGPPDTAPREAALVAVATAGRTVVVAGIAVMIAMVGALLVVPGDLLESATIGILTAVAISVLAALTALPAILVTLGPRINRWSVGEPGAGDSRLGLRALRLLRRPGLAGGLVLALVVALASPAVALDLGPPSARVLPDSQTEREDFEAFERKLGTGWTAPYEVIVAAEGGALTEPARVAGLDRFQRRLGHHRDVEAVLGPGELGPPGRARTDAAALLVVGEGDVTSAGHPLRPVLEREVERLGRDSRADARLGGPATRLQDYDTATSDRLWVLAVVLSAVTYLVLVPILRSVLLPLLAVGLTLVTVAAAFGVLVLLFQGDALMGGAGYVDGTITYGIFGIVFGLAIDYQVFLLMRIREGYSLLGSTDAAIAHGLRKTAGVITGAALIMAGVFVAFAVSDIAVMRQAGVALTVAVLLDATLVRLVLLPAAMLVCGDACWWLPRPLGRMLPTRREDAPAASVYG